MVVVLFNVNIINYLEGFVLGLQLGNKILVALLLRNRALKIRL